MWEKRGCVAYDSSASHRIVSEKHEGDEMQNYHDQPQPMLFSNTSD